MQYRHVQLYCPYAGKQSQQKIQTSSVTTSKPKKQLRKRHLKNVTRSKEKQSSVAPKSAIATASTVTKPVYEFSDATIQGCKDLCDRLASGEKLQLFEIPYGETTVYFPDAFPAAVLKQSGEDCSVRLQQSQEIAKELEQLGCTHLTVPVGSEYAGFIIEERLPVSPVFYQNMSLYTSHPNCFDKAIKEMVTLLSRYCLTDLFTEPGKNPIMYTNGYCKIPRYDNVPLYLTPNTQGQQEGKLGLVDLEHAIQFINTTVKRPHALKEIRQQALKSLAMLFPYHLEQIKEQANQLGFTYTPKLLTEAAVQAKQFIKAVVTDYDQWQQKQGIPEANNNHLWQPEIPRKFREVLITLVEAELLILDKGEKPSHEYTFKNHLTEIDNFLKCDKSDHPLSESIVTTILMTLQTVQNKWAKEELNDNLVFSHTAQAQRLSLRSVTVKRSIFHKKLILLLQSSPEVISNKFNNKCWDSSEQHFVEYLFQIVVKRLIKENKLFAYDPGYSTGGHNYCWLRF